MSNTSFQPLRQSSFRHSRQPTGRMASVTHSVSGVSRLPSAATTHEMSIDTTEQARDGVVELTKNSKYCVSKLPATPVVLKGGHEIADGTTDEATNHAVVVSEDKTYVWDYSLPDHVPNTINFPLPNAQSSPLSVLVAPGPNSSEPGLATIDVNDGTVTYWEGVGSAMADGLLHRRKSIQHQVTLYTGEWVDHLQNAEPAGLVATTSSGRYVFITLRDANGKAAITSRTMKGQGVGFLSTFKGAFIPQSHRRGVVSVKPGPKPSGGNRSERQVFIINEHGDITVWELSRSGYSKILLDERLQDILLTDQLLKIYPHAAKTFCVHDVEVNTEKEVFFVLASFEQQHNFFHYMLYTLSVEGGVPQVKSTHRLQSYTGVTTRVPRLLYPAPYDTLFAVFSHGIVLIEAFSQYAPKTGRSRRWEDVITLKHDVTVVGAGKEDIQRDNGKIKRNCGIVVLASNSGVMRVERFEEPAMPVETKLTALEPELAKSRVEQAVFYGSGISVGASAGAGNPVDFDQATGVKIQPQVLENAVLEVSHGILTTQTAYMPPILPSTHEHLSLRVKYLERLAQYLHSNYTGDQFSVKARLQLLWDLQKTVVAKSLWAHIDKQLHEERANVLVTVINKNSKPTEDSDALRHWFIQEAAVIDELMVEVSQYCSNTRDVDVLVDSNAVLLEATYKAALNVENDYSRVYWLDKNSACDKAPWISSPQLIKAFEQQYHLTKNAYHALGKNDKNATELSTHLLFIVETLCALYSQRLTWIANSDSSDHEEGEQLCTAYVDKRSGWLRELVNTGNKSGALKIADQFKIHRALVEILIEDWQLTVANEGQVAGQPHMDAIRNHLDREGYEFASVLYQYLFDTNQLKSLLTMFPEYGHHLDTFFSSKRHANISWVNDVTKERYAKAAETLVDANNSVEDASANQKLRLSIAKLCVLEDGNNVLLNDINSQLQVTDIQGIVVTQLSVTSDDPLDNLASHGRRAMFKVAQRVLNRINQKRSITVEELIDALTLLKLDSNDAQFNFYRALKLIDSSPMSDERKRLNEQLIWRRLLLVDNWQNIVNTKSKSDAKVQEKTEKTVFYQTVLNVLGDKILSEQGLQFANEPSNLVNAAPGNQLANRYPYAGEGEVKEIAKDIERENNMIQEAIQKYSLASWTKGILARVENVAATNTTDTKSVIDQAPRLQKSPSQQAMDLS